MTDRRTARFAWKTAALATLVAAAVAAPRTAGAQTEETRLRPLGEDYHVELSGTLWNPTVFGVISSEQFGIIGSQIDFENDLGFQQTRFKDLRIVLRPSEKHRFRMQYTPVTYSASTTFTRNIVFNGIEFPVSLPIESAFEWKVFRMGYEYDFLYEDWGFVGVLLEGRYTQFSAELDSAIATEYTRLTVPLPAFGAVGRFYVVPEVAINFELTGFKFPDVDPEYQANYFDWDIHGTVNFTNNIGFQAGWRRMSTFINIESDTGDMKFQGMWFGAAVRY
jgi:hypothetical protein